MPAPSPRLVVRCFANEDEALVDEWPVNVTARELKTRFKVTDPSQILPIDEEMASALVGNTLGPWSESVTYFLEPEALEYE